VLGPSGAGKSTLINLLVPGALAETNEISQALNSGKHTTTSTTWYWVDEARTTALIDSPGFQEFGLNHIDPMNLAGLHAGPARPYRQLQVLQLHPPA
jgi:ribosome biogenesis GTPase